MSGRHETCGVANLQFLPRAGRRPEGELGHVGDGRGGERGEAGEQRQRERAEGKAKRREEGKRSGRDKVRQEIESVRERQQRQQQQQWRQRRRRRRRWRRRRQQPGAGNRKRSLGSETGRVTGAPPPRLHHAVVPEDMEVPPGWGGVRKGRGGKGEQRG